MSTRVCIRDGCGRPLTEVGPFKEGMRPFWYRYCAEHRMSPTPVEVITEIPANTYTKWPESTCVECGRRIASGWAQQCLIGGYCSWHVPAALRERININAELLAALKACHLQMLQSNNSTEYAEEANQLAIAAIAKAEEAK